MSIFAISDLHLSLDPRVDKPMDIYGERWHDHKRRLERNWKEKIKEDDTTIVAGDISWGMRLDEAKADLDWLDSLPGHKVLFKGNHDLWWTGITKLNAMYEDMTFIQNDFYLAEGTYICGTRGWTTPDNDEYSDADEKVYKRELLRLRASFDAAKEHMSGRGTEAEILGVMHYPPVSKPASFSGFMQIFEDYGVKRVIYGHIHGEEGFGNTIMGKYHGVEYRLVSVDYLNCVPILVK